jgi:hypothetical protein
VHLTCRFIVIRSEAVLNGASTDTDTGVCRHCRFLQTVNSIQFTKKEPRQPKAWWDSCYEVKSE